jgi:hypothetical protein
MYRFMKLLGLQTPRNDERNGVYFERASPLPLMDAS